MNKVRRKALSEIAEQIGTLRDELETLRDEEDEYARTSPKACKAEKNMSCLNRQATL